MHRGRQWHDTVFEMMSAQPINFSTKCTDVDTARQRWTFETIDNVSGRAEKCVLGGDGTTIERSIEGVYIAQRRMSGVKSAAAATVVAKTDDILRQPVAGSITELFALPAGRACPSDKSIAVIFTDSTLSLDETVQYLYKKQGAAWVMRDMPSRCPQRSTPVPDTALTQWLKPNIAIQSDHPEIIELAGSIRGKETEPCAIVAEFNHYVFSHVRKKNAAVFSNALETLHAGYGDCGEHAALLTALLRAAGVPARVALGLLYVESKKGYFYHVQVLAYAGEWILADPTWDVFPASGRFVPLIIDDTGSKAMLLSRLVGRIKIGYVTSEGK